MTDATVYGLRACDSCRKAVAGLRAAGLEVALRDIRDEPVPPETLAAWGEAFGAALVNRRSTTWRGLDEAARARPAEALLAAHPALVKRPVIEAAGRRWLGWTPATADQVAAAVRDG